MAESSPSDHGSHGSSAVADDALLYSQPSSNLLLPMIEDHFGAMTPSDHPSYKFVNG